MTAFVVSVPATTGNLGPGFDCLGAALSLFNKFEFSLTNELNKSNEPQISAFGLYGPDVALDKTNLIYSSLAKFFAYIDRPVPSLAIKIEANIPLSRGLGSSATAIVGGIVGGNLLAGSPCTQKQLLDLAIKLEGHPDNVAAAMLGGCQLSATNPDGDWEICSIPWHPDVAVAVAIPNFRLSTAEARAVLPQSVPMSDAVFNAAHLALLTQGLNQGNSRWLQTALNDRLHQPYRQNLIIGMNDVQTAATIAGAYGAVISGAGPTLLALGHPKNMEAIAKAMIMAWQKTGIVADGKVLALATCGTTCYAN